MKNKWKMDQKSTKNQSKMDQTSIKNRWKSRSGGLWGRFGGLLGRLGRSNGSLKASWTVLEASWKRLGREKWPTWLQLGPKLGPKLELKWIKNPSKNRSKNWCLLGSVFGRILVDFGRENGAKLAPKSHPTCGFLKIFKNAIGASPLAPNEVRGVQVGS